MKRPVLTSLVGWLSFVVQKEDVVVVLLKKKHCLVVHREWIWGPALAIDLHKLLCGSVP